MRVAIVGSREYPDLSAVARYVDGLDRATVVITGGARGVDLEAEYAATRRGLELVIYRPQYAVHGKRAPLVRNQLIVDDCDRLVAFHDGKSTGTMHTVGLARKAGKPVEIITPASEGSR